MRGRFAPPSFLVFNSACGTKSEQLWLSTCKTANLRPCYHFAMAADIDSTKQQATSLSFLIISWALFFFMVVILYVFAHVAFLIASFAAYNPTSITLFLGMPLLPIISSVLLMFATVQHFRSKFGSSIQASKISMALLFLGFACILLYTWMSPQNIQF
jgi:hypothetical protein